MWSRHILNFLQFSSNADKNDNNTNDKKTKPYSCERNKEKNLQKNKEKAITHRKHGLKAAKPHKKNPKGISTGLRTFCILFLAKKYKSK